MARTRHNNRRARSNERKGLNGAQPAPCPIEVREDLGLRPQEFPGRTGRANRGRPLAGLHFLVVHPDDRYEYADFRMAPDDLTLEMLWEHEEGVTLRRLAKTYALSLSGLKRRLRNARDFLDAMDIPHGAWHCQREHTPRWSHAQRTRSSHHRKLHSAGIEHGSAKVDR